MLVLATLTLITPSVVSSCFSNSAWSQSLSMFQLSPPTKTLQLPSTGAAAAAAWWGSSARGSTVSSESALTCSSARVGSEDPRVSRLEGTGLEGKGEVEKRRPLWTGQVS